MEKLIVIPGLCSVNYLFYLSNKYKLSDIYFLGSSIFDKDIKVSVALERKVLVAATDFVEGIKTVFACYYVFGYSYPLQLAKTLEFLQR